MSKTCSIIAVALLCHCAAVLAVDGVPVRFDANYALYSKGAKIADMDRSMTPQADGTYLFKSDTHTAGLISLFRKDHVVEQSTWELAGGVLKPLQYLYSHTGGRKNRNVAVKFDWGANRITNIVNGDSWKMPTAPNVMDKLLYQFAIMHDLEAGRQSLAYTIADGGKIKTYRFEPQGRETIKTPLGELQTLKLVRFKPNSSRRTTLWCALRYRYLPVKVVNEEDDGGRTTAIIQSLTGLSN